MTHRLIGSIVFIFAMVLLPSVWAEDKELPLGYLAVTEVEGGNLQVLARCVETKRVLEEIAKHTGAPVVFDTPCNTYVSQVNSKRIMTAEKWMEFISLSGAELFCKNEGGKWQVMPSAKDSFYYPNQNEDEIKNAFKVNLADKSPETGGISTGLVFFHGKLIPPPYKVSYRINVDNTVDIIINDVSVQHYNSGLMNFPPRTTPNQTPTLPSDEQFDSFLKMSGYITMTFYPQLLQKMSQEEALTQLIQFVAKQKIIEKVEPLMTSNNKLGNVMVDYKDSHYPTTVHNSTLFPTNYDFETGKVIASKQYTDAQAPEKNAKVDVNTIEAGLKQDKLFFYGKTRDMAFNDNMMIESFANCIKKTKETSSLLQAECILSEVITNKSLARELAVNIDDKVVSKVKTVLLRKKKELTP